LRDGLDPPEADQLGADQASLHPGAVAAADPPIHSPRQLAVTPPRERAMDRAAAGPGRPDRHRGRGRVSDQPPSATSTSEDASGRRFESLTRTYEDVRYGNRPIAHATLRAVDEDRRSMMDLIRRSARADLIAEGAQEVTEG